MPELEDRIVRWRARTAAALPGRPELVAELEGHLRDAVDDLMHCGHSPAEAFLLAETRLGDTTALAREFHQLLAPQVTARSSREVHLLAYTAGVLGLLGGVGYATAVYRWGRDFASGHFDFAGRWRDVLYAALTVVLLLLCGLVVRASRRVLTGVGGHDAGDVISFLLLVIWLFASNRLWFSGYARDWYPVFLLVGAMGMVGLRRAWRKRLMRTTSGAGRPE